MPVKITNVSQDPAYAMKRRTASRLQMEPVIAGERLRLRQSRVLTDEQAAANTDWLAECERAGVIIIERDGETKLQTQPVLAVPDPQPEGEKEVPPPPDMVQQPPSIPAPPPPPAPSETPSTEATTQPLPNMGHRKDDKKRGR